MIVGPYFTSVDSKVILTCVLETIKLFQHHGLKTSLLVCDGCAANLTTIKITHGHCGAYSILDAASTDRYEIKPWLINPFSPPVGWYAPHTRYSTCVCNVYLEYFRTAEEHDQCFFFCQKLVAPSCFNMAKKCVFGWATIAEMYKRKLTNSGSNKLAWFRD